jgi:hypothetical protein
VPIDVVKLGSRDERIDGGGPPAAFVRTGKRSAAAPVAATVGASQGKIALYVTANQSSVL